MHTYVRTCTYAHTYTHLCTYVRTHTFFDDKGGVIFLPFLLEVVHCPFLLQRGVLARTRRGGRVWWRAKVRSKVRSNATTCPDTKESCGISTGNEHAQWYFKALLAVSIEVW